MAQLATVAMLAQTGLGMVRAIQENKAAERRRRVEMAARDKADEARKADLEREAAADERERRDTLRRALAAQRARAAAAGTTPLRGSSGAVLRNLIERSAVEGDDARARFRAQLDAINRNIAYRRRLNLLERRSGRRRLGFGLAAEALTVPGLLPRK